MALIDRDNFITHLVWSGLVDKATCGELKKTIELCTIKDIYTKADVVAMLEQLDSEIQEQIAFMGDGEEANGMKRADNLVKDKINALKQSMWQDNCNVKKE